jgi:hypothetical protein
VVERIFRGHRLGLFQRNPVKSCIHVTCPSPCFRRKSEIMSAGEDSAAAKPLKSRTNESKMANSGFM